MYNHNPIPIVTATLGLYEIAQYEKDGIYRIVEDLYRSCKNLDLDIKEMDVKPVRVCIELDAVVWEFTPTRWKDLDTGKTHDLAKKGRNNAV